MPLWFGIGYILFLVLYFVWYKPAKDEEQRLYSEALKISKFFGDTKIALFQFPDTEDSQLGKRGVYALVEFDEWNDVPDNIKDHRNHYVVDSWSERGVITQKKSAEKTKRLCAILPYSVRQFSVDIPFRDYKGADQW